jgi:integrase
MSRPHLPYLWRQRTRHGTIAWYFARERNKRIRIRGEYGSQEFMDAYNAALSGTAPIRQIKAAVHSLAWLIEQYRDSGAWSALALATRRNRENHFRQVCKTAGDKPHRAIDRVAIIAGLDRRAKTPNQARNFLDAMKGLFKWAKDKGHRADDPTDGISNPKRKTGDGFPIWSEDDVDRYYAKWPLGTRQRVWIDVLLFTGGRRGDAVTIGRQHVRDGIATFRTEKSQGKMVVSIPILPVLQRTLEAGPTGELAFVCGKSGKPFRKESFGNAFKDACVAAGVMGKSAHGCRKIGATRAAENGATVAELNAIFGWTGTAMASLYTQAADRKRLARQAAEKLERDGPEKNENRISMLTPRQKV